MRVRRGCAACLGLLVVAEMADCSFSVRFHNAFAHSDGCGQRFRSVFCVLMVAEMADFAFSARVRSACWHSDGCGVAISARSRNSFCMLMVAAMLERALSAWFRKVCSQTRPRPRDV